MQNFCPLSFPGVHSTRRQGAFLSWPHPPPNNTAICPPPSMTASLHTLSPLHTHSLGYWGGGNYVKCFTMPRVTVGTERHQTQGSVTSGTFCPSQTCRSMPRNLFQKLLISPKGPRSSSTLITKFTVPFNILGHWQNGILCVSLVCPHL